jgi:hypothetical protein
MVDRLPLRLLLPLFAAVTLAACANREPGVPLPEPRPEVLQSVAGPYEITHSTTAEGVGAGQAVFLRDRAVYLLGDLRENDQPGPGVIREFFWSTDERGRKALRASGRQILLTDNGEPVAPHPTGLTWHPNFGYWLGDTVNQKGTIFHIDFERALTQGNLDGCVLHRVDDDAAVNGTRPHFFEIPGDRWVLATSDYGESGNTLRLYDPLALMAADKTSERGVLYAEAPCGPFVQSLMTDGTPGRIWLVQNQTPGLGYRLSELEVDEAGRIRATTVTDFSSPTDELEACVWLETDRSGRREFLMLSAAEVRNVYLGRWVPPRRPVR